MSAIPHRIAASGSEDPDVVDEFLTAGAGGRYAAGTVKSYRFALGYWRKLLGERIRDPASWSPRDVEAYQLGFAKRGCAAGTRQLASSALRACLRWCARHDRGVRPDLHLAVDAVVVKRRLPRPIPPQDLDRILAYFGKLRPGAPIAWWRDRALFLYLLATGARVSEALQLDVDQIPNGVVVRQKGGYDKVLFATDVALQAVADYVARRRDNHPALWVTRGTPEHPVRALTGDGVREIWIRLADHLGIKRWTTHQIRHTCATELMDAGVAPEVIASHLGHHGLSSLANYAELRPGRRREAVEALGQRMVSRAPAGTLPLTRAVR